MNVFETHKKIIDDYASYIHSFIHIADPEIQSVVDRELGQGKLWPDPLLQFNPAYEKVGDVAEVAGKHGFHESMADLFHGYTLYTHQLEALLLGKAGRDFIVTSGTGSGKSLTYIATIFQTLLAEPQSEGATAIVVYPLNALINSQTNAFKSYQAQYERRTGKAFPITFGQYTGQEREEARATLRQKPPQILLTNYMMLELLLTRISERPIRDALYANLRFLVFDELHLYRGRQGADVALLIRRIRARCRRPLTFIGTSATMVSTGSATAQREEVARVATTLFGRPFKPDQVVGERLDRSLTGTEPTQQALAAALAAGIGTDGEEAKLRAHPLAVWLEKRIALEERAGQLIRRAPLRIGEVVAALAEDSGEDETACRVGLENLLLWISAVNQRIQDGGSPYTILPFKLHQFVSQTGSVYTTLEQDKERFITLQPGIYKQDDHSKAIFPNVFSRASGHPFLCVSWKGDRLLPREFRESSEEDDDEATDGYLVVGKEIWDPTTDFDDLPEAWFRMTRSGPVPEKEKAPFFPTLLYFDAYGACSETQPMTYQGWFLRAPLLFDPTGGVFFDAKTNEGTKLTRLGSEGRSTSTTIMVFSILNRLRDAGYSVQDQKALSFTDNRQDAALQAGHFNDFTHVVQLRAAIYRALEAAPSHTLTYTTLGEAVFKALALPFRDYANREEVPALAPIRRKYEQTFETYLFYQAVADLRRSWRIVLPNLEQCGLLAIEYEYLDDIVHEDSFWADLIFVRDLSHGNRREFLSTILDFFRMEYALHSENFLTPDRLKAYTLEFRETLRAPWTLDHDERLPEPSVIRLETLRRAEGLYAKSMGPTSAPGKYIKQLANQKGFERDLLRGDRYRDFIRHLMEKLTDADYLVKLRVRSEKNEEVSVFRLRVDKIRWTLGDGEHVKTDVIKRRSYKDQNPKPNVFFRDMYRWDFSQGKRLRAEDHTGQLKAELRQDREERFRAEWFVDEAKKIPDEARIRSEAISALFCSPTMELGIDIGGLSVVHLRNAPPNPANYAQRSGRAGRSGQGALVFTYCSNFSPHDRHYFEHQSQLVAGVVLAPRLDLCNRELLLTHLNALAIGEIGLPGLAQQGVERPSLMRLIVDDSREMPLAVGVREGLKIGPTTFTTLKALFRQIIQDLRPDLETRCAAWYSDDWIDRNLGDLADNLDGSLNRWRCLYRSARTLLTSATQPIESGRLSVGSPEYKRYKRDQDQANRQLNLLRNDGTGGGELSEFYPYRYLASEGFLPGYNFIRLPIRVFVPTGSTSGEFISRPRSLALREFGPLNILYHNGRKYRISQLITPDLESALSDAKVSLKAGYFLTGEQKDLEICPFSGANLSDNANKTHLHDLLEMAESRAEERDRISCEEEERVSRGYTIQTYFAVDSWPFQGVQKAIARVGETTLLNLRYLPAARLVHVNSQWRTRPSEGFPIGLTTGFWRDRVPEPSGNAREDHRLVKLWTSTVADALYLEPVKPLGLMRDGVVTLQYALKRAIETVFQVEPNEIGAVAVGDSEAPNILLYEAAEGSLGILSEFITDARIFHTVVAMAQRVCRFDEADYRAPASYDDLLSYYNQRDHLIIDRFLIRGALERLAASAIEIQTNTGYPDYESQYQDLLRHSDPNSSTERTFLKHLYDNGLRLPDAAQKRVDGLFCQPDYYYEPRVWVFCDGSPHDDPEVRETDEEQRQLLIARGDEVWVWHYRENLTDRVARRPDLFRKVR